MDDVIKLVSKVRTGQDEYLNPIYSETIRTVFCDVETVTRSEFYQAAQTGLHPSYVFVLSHYVDYDGEKELLYTDFTGQEKRFDIIRVFVQGDRLEITAQERIGNG